MATIVAVEWLRMEESFRLTYADGKTTEVRHGRASELYEHYPELWQKFTEAMGKPGEKVAMHPSR